MAEDVNSVVALLNAALSSVSSVTVRAAPPPALKVLGQKGRAVVGAAR
jgi:hypothetical protein